MTEIKAGDRMCPHGTVLSVGKGQTFRMNQIVTVWVALGSTVIFGTSTSVFLLEGFKKLEGETTECE